MNVEHQLPTCVLCSSLDWKSFNLDATVQAVSLFLPMALLKFSIKTSVFLISDE